MLGLLGNCILWGNNLIMTGNRFIKLGLGGGGSTINESYIVIALYICNVENFNGAMNNQVD